MIDRSRADSTRRRLLKYKAIVTGADRHRVIPAHINRVVAVADRYRVVAANINRVVAIADRYGGI